MVEEFIQRKHGQQKVRYILPETRADPGRDLRRHRLPGAGDADRRGDRRLHHGRGRRAAQGDGQEEGRGDGEAEGEVRRRRRGARHTGASKAEELWDYIEPFAGYGFNKSHSVAYAMLAYQTAYLKAHYPVAFMAAMLTSEMASTDDDRQVHRRVPRHGHRGAAAGRQREQLARSPSRATRIRFGLGAVKGVGEGAVEAILEARRRVGRFRSLAHLATEVDLRVVNHKVFECLVKAGCFDPLGSTRGALLRSARRACSTAAQRRARARGGAEHPVRGVAGAGAGAASLGDRDCPSRQRAALREGGARPLPHRQPARRARGRCSPAGSRHTATDLPEGDGRPP